MTGIVVIVVVVIIVNVAVVALFVIGDHILFGFGQSMFFWGS